MGDFRDGNVKVLVATDVVGRGIDVTNISHIINYDIPQFCDDYVHRVGRTGRMGREGVAYTFVSPEEGTELTRIEMRIDRLLKRDEMPGFQAFNRPVASAAALAESPDGIEAMYGPDETTQVAPPPKKAVPPLIGRGGRSPRRNRRAAPKATLACRFRRQSRQIDKMADPGR